MIKTIPALLALILIAGLTGCASLKDVWQPGKSLLPSMSLASKDKSAKVARDVPLKKGFGLPVEFAVVWNETVYHQPGADPVRGFGGRVFFYDKNNQAIKVNGDLIVYGFEVDNDGVETGDTPPKKFVFRESELQSHCSDSGLGPSYSFWLPFEKVGGYRKTVSLIPNFRFPDGIVLQAEPSINGLNGRVRETEVAGTKEQTGTKSRAENSSLAQQNNYRSGVQTANGHVQHRDQTSMQRRDGADSDIRTSTIRVPRSLARQMAAAAAQKRPLSASHQLAATRREPTNQGNELTPRPLETNNVATGNQFVPQTTTVGTRVAELPAKPKRRAYGDPRGE